MRFNAVLITGGSESDGSGKIRVSFERMGFCYGFIVSVYLIIDLIIHVNVC